MLPTQPTRLVLAVRNWVANLSLCSTLTPPALIVHLESARPSTSAAHHIGSVHCGLTLLSSFPSGLSHRSTWLAPCACRASLGCVPCSCGATLGLIPALISSPTGEKDKLDTEPEYDAWKYVDDVNQSSAPFMLHLGGHLILRFTREIPCPNCRGEGLPCHTEHRDSGIAFTEHLKVMMDIDSDNVISLGEAVAKALEDKGFKSDSVPSRAGNTQDTQPDEADTLKTEPGT